MWLLSGCSRTIRIECPVPAGLVFELVCLQPNLPVDNFPTQLSNPDVAIPHTLRLPPSIDANIAPQILLHPLAILQLTMVILDPATTARGQQPTYVCPEVVHVVEFCRTKEGEDLLAWGTIHAKQNLPEGGLTDLRKLRRRHAPRSTAKRTISKREHGRELGFC